MEIDDASKNAHPIDSAWASSGDAAVPRHRSLTRAQIVETAVDILDSEGSAELLTMRVLGARLGVTSAALYWHIKTRNELLDRALDEVFAEVELPPIGDRWEDDVRRLLLSWRRTMLAHPWSPPLAGRPLLGPHVMLRIEYLQHGLVRAGLTGFTLAAATRMLADYVVGSALTESAAQQSDQDALRAHARLRIAEHPETYPTLASSGHLDSVPPDGETMFLAVLDEMLRVVTAPEAFDRNSNHTPAKQ
ncbi:TetR/AcrR family transcriptional regulator C-terminal domain-containing protein [Microbacterium oleivorans]|uniref:TetR/AcrR family transcriptional regulator C-terminal domain-containing protein n=1 Tax=Microbacterium oleivorans TaxID=273677 RepID=A0A7D5EW85_9MICO|nr:TetR/AcrR family transcriptional regulator C-terminal domain-containing protein [Microbacterium oleivorans]QLD12472.1 TetR/AcrR family transcriptional regulator C-terminal domain-containing protein [Microbacterium oleivorans]